MESREAGLNELGNRIDAVLAEATRPADQIRSARTALLEEVTSGTRRGSRWSFLRVGRKAFAVAALGLASAAAAGFWFYNQPLSFEVGGTGVTAGLSVPIAAERGESVPLRFSEGSSVVLHPGGRVRVLGTKSTGAHVLLESGSIDVAITHRERETADWKFDAGPLSVAITGTKFRLAWSPRDQTFNLVLSEGSVSVSGACLPQPKSVRAGEQLELTCGLPEPLASAGTAPEAEAALDEPAAPMPAAPAPAAPAPESSGAPAERGWRELLENGELASALAAAERADFEAVCRTASQTELLELADAARLGGDFSKANLALNTLRRRFPRSANAAAAAFSLGRIAFERRGAYAEATRWFATYLEEAPNGPLMGDAVGRLMEARQRQGDLAGARADAERYLARFPKGPYASVAKRLLAGQ
jgi:TolA-binding protein